MKQNWILSTGNHFLQIERDDAPDNELPMLADDGAALEACIQDAHAGIAEAIDALAAIAQSYGELIAELKRESSFSFTDQKELSQHGR